MAVPPPDWAAVARLQPAPKALIVYLDGALLWRPAAGAVAAAAAGLAGAPAGLAAASDGAACANLHRLAAEGCSGLLALRQQPAGAGEHQRLASELAQLLGLSVDGSSSISGSSGSSSRANAEAAAATPGGSGSVDGAGVKADAGPSTAATRPPSARTRFRGLASALLTHSPAAAEFGLRAGFRAVLPLSPAGGPLLPDPAAACARALALLGLDEAFAADGGSGGEPAATAAAASASAAERYELLLVHLQAERIGEALEGETDASEKGFADEADADAADVVGGAAGLPSGAGNEVENANATEAALQRRWRWRGARAALRWADALVARLDGTAPAAAAQILLILLLGPGAEADAGPTLGAPPPGGAAAAAAGLRPPQSYELSGGQRVAGLRPRGPVLAVQRLRGSVRQDGLERLDAYAAQHGGANGTILADHLLAEVAYKLGRAPKYGA